MIRRYRRTRLAADKDVWFRQLRTMYKLYSEKSRRYWRGKISDSKGNSRKLWSTLSGVMGEKGERCNSNVHRKDRSKIFKPRCTSGVR